MCGDLRGKTPLTLSQTLLPNTPHRIYKKTQDYLELFSRYHSLDTVRNVRQ